MVQLVKTCCYCHVRKDNLLRCGKYGKATYCSKKCQVNHWSNHKSVCKLVCESYTVEIKMSETKSFKEFEFVDNTIGGQRAFMFFILDPKRIYKTFKCFVVKIIM